MNIHLGQCPSLAFDTAFFCRTSPAGRSCHSPHSSVFTPQSPLPPSLILSLCLSVFTAFRKPRISLELSQIDISLLLRLRFCYFYSCILNFGNLPIAKSDMDNGTLRDSSGAGQVLQIAQWLLLLSSKVQVSVKN